MNNQFNRRDFLKSAALLPLCAAGAGLGISSVSAIEPIKRVGGSNFKIAINAYSFTGPLPQTHEDQTIGATMPLPTPSKPLPPKTAKKGTRKGGSKMTIFDLLDFCSKNNIDGCDPTGYFFPTYPTPPTDDYIYSLKRHAFEIGVGISGTGVRNNFTTADKGLRDHSVQKIKNW